MTGYFDAMLDARDRLLASAGFQKWAAAFPLTRPVARRRARAVFDLCAGFVYSQILFACVKLGLLDLLKAGPRQLEDLAREMKLTEEAGKRLLDGAVAIGVAGKRSGGRYGLGPHGAAIVANPGILHMIEHHSLFYEDMSNPIALLRGEAGETALRRYWAYAGAGNVKALKSSQVGSYSDLMSGSQPLVAGEILDAFPLGNFRSLLDVGGGDGTFLKAVAQRYANLELSLFDLPAVADLARERLKEAGLEGRIKIAGGDFAAGPLPAGADVVTLVRIIHDHPDETVAKLLASIRRALPRGGRLLIAEPLAETKGAETVGHAYFGFYLLAMGSGRPRTFEEIQALLEAAGFTRSRSIATRMPLQTSLIVAHC